MNSAEEINEMLNILKDDLHKHKHNNEDSFDEINESLKSIVMDIAIKLNKQNIPITITTIKRYGNANNDIMTKSLSLLIKDGDLIYCGNINNEDAYSINKK